MNAQTWQRVRELFEALVETPMAERAARLEGSCIDQSESLSRACKEETYSSSKPKGN